MLLPLLFTIKRSLSIWLKQSVYLNIIPTQQSVISRHISGATSTASSTTRYEEMPKSAASRTAGTTRHYEVLQVVLRNSTRCY